MTPRWILSKFHKDDDGHIVPFAGDYGGKWYCPMHPPQDEWGLVQVYLNAHQIDAMKEDDRLVVCPHLFDPRPVPDQVVQTYEDLGATTGMSLAVLLATLSDTIPHYGHTL